MRHAIYVIEGLIDDFNRLIVLLILDIKVIQIVVEIAAVERDPQEYMLC